MLSRHILATCLIAVMGGAASGQVDESPLDVLKRLRAEEQAEQQNPLDQFDILDLPEHLFERRTPTQPRRKLPPLELDRDWDCLLYTSPSPRDQRGSRMPSSA